MQTSIPRWPASPAGALALLVLLLAAGGCAHSHHRNADGYPSGDVTPEPMETFPPAGTDLVHHDLRIDVFQVSDGQETLLETLTFDGRMLLERGDPYVNQYGVRQVDFEVESWEAVTWSEALDTSVIYRSVIGEEQPTSSIVAEKPGQDFPATFTFNVVFDAYAGGALVHRRHHGRPEGGGFLVVPPNGDRRLSPTITAFEQTQIEIEHPELGLLRFKPRDCNDRESTTLSTASASAGR